MRTTIEIPLRRRSVDEAISIIDRILNSYGFQKKILEGEEVWLKGDGVIVVLQCFAVCFKENSLLLQGWIKDAITGEAELKGFRGALPKKKMRTIMDSIENEISSTYDL